MESGRKSFAMSGKFECRKFSPNMFNKSKCQHCFAAKDLHSAEALENNRASRKVSKCGYLFVAPDWDFSNQIYRTKRWQRRWFVLYDDGELTYAVDEHPDTVPQGAVDMGKVLEVSDAEEVTGNKFSIAITAPDKVHFVKGTCKEESKWWFDVLSMFPRFVKGRQRRNATFPGIKGASAHTQLVAPASGQRDTVIRSRFLSCRTDTFEEDPVIISAVTSCDKNGSSPVIVEPMPSPPLPRLVPANSASGRELGVAVTVASSYEPRDVIIQQKSAPSDCALTLILAENGLGAGSRRTPRRLQRRRSPEEPPPERSKSAGPLSPVETQQPMSSSDHDKNEANRNNNRYSAPLYLRISDVPKVKRYDSLDLIHLDQDGPLSPKGRTVSESQGGSQEKDDIDGPKVVSWTEKTPQRPFDGGVPEGTFKEHTVRGDPDGCGLDHAVKYNIPEIRVDNSPDETLFIKKGWLMRKEDSKDWLKHWFVLCGPTLVRHADPAAEVANLAEQTINMSMVMQVRETEVARNYGIEITLCDGSTHLLSALTAGLRAGWVQALRNAALQRNNGNMATVPPSLSIGDKIENVAVRRTVLGSDEKSSAVAVEESSSRALPSSPPLNRTAISRVKERARHKGVLRPVGKTLRDHVTTEEDTPGCSSVVSGRATSSLRGRNPIRRHTLPARTGPSFDPGVDANMWTASELLSNLDAGSNNAELLRKWTRAIENRHGIAADSSPRNNSTEISSDVGNGKTKGVTMDNVVEGGTRKTKMLTLKNVSDLTDGFQAEPSSREEWAGRCDELKRKLEAAIREIRELKAELKKSHDNTDDLELRCFRLERTGGESEKRHRDEVALLSVRVQDLASKLANAERQLRHLAISPTNRRPRSLKGRESVSVSRELEMKMEDLESRLVSVEGSLGGGGGGGGGEGTKAEEDVYGDKGTTVRLARSSSFTSVTESLAMHSKLRDMDARMNRAAKKIQSNQMTIQTRRPSLSATLSRLRNLAVTRDLGVEEGFVREIKIVGEFVVRGRDCHHDDVEEVGRLCSSLERSLSGLRDGKDSSSTNSHPSPLSAFWDIEGEKEEFAGEDVTAAISRLTQMAAKVTEIAEEVIVANIGGVMKQEAVKILDYLHRSSQMTRAEVGAARLLLDCSADAEGRGDSGTLLHFVACKAEERLKALREEMKRLSPVPSTEVVSSTIGVNVDRLAGIMIGKALLAAQMRMVARSSSEDVAKSDQHQGAIEEAKAMVAEMKPSQRSVLASLLMVGLLEGPWKGGSVSTPCQRCEVLAERFAEITRRHEDELKKLRKEEVTKVTVAMDALKEEEQRAVVSRLEDEVANLRDQLRSMVEDYEQHVTALKETFEQELSRRSEVRVGAVSVHQKYQTEMEQLKSLCEKGMAAIDHSHRRILMGLEEKHRREMEHVRAEKEQALAEETQATLAALDAMRKAHETELQREVAKFKEEYLSKMHASSDLEALRQEHEEEMESIKREILFLSRKYSLKCLDSASLEEQVELQGRQIREANELIFDVTARNKQLRVHLKQNIRELQNLTKNMENSGHKQSIQELQLQLQLKENQLVEKAEQMADLERQLVEAKNHHRALEQQCQALDVSLRANGRALGDEVNGLKARLEQVILASLATAEGWSSQSPQEKDRTQRSSFSIAEPKSKRSPVAAGTRIREAVAQQSPPPQVNAKRELTGTEKSSTVRLAGVVASRKRLFEDTDVQRS